MALSTCSMASVVTASFKFSITSSTFYCIAKLPFQLSKCCFVNFFICGVAVMPHKYIFQSKASAVLNTEPILCKLTSSKTIIIGVFAELLKSATDFRSNSLFSSFHSFWVCSIKKSFRN
jgi:hypothetical protein